MQREVSLECGELRELRVGEAGGIELERDRLVAAGDGALGDGEPGVGRVLERPGRIVGGCPAEQFGRPGERVLAHPVGARLTGARERRVGHDDLEHVRRERVAELDELARGRRERVVRPAGRAAHAVVLVPRRAVGDLHLVRPVVELIGREGVHAVLVAVLHERREAVGLPVAGASDLRLEAAGQGHDGALGRRGDHLGVGVPEERDRLRPRVV